MDEYAEEKRTEKNLIVRSGICEAETTDNKRLCSTFCIEAMQTRSIARPLCDSRASYHRLRGSASTVLTATGQVNGRWRILTPHRIETHEPTATKFHTIDYVRRSARGTPKPNLVKIHPLGASGHMGEI